MTDSYEKVKSVAAENLSKLPFVKAVFCKDEGRRTYRITSVSDELNFQNRRYLVDAQFSIMLKIPENIFWFSQRMLGESMPDGMELIYQYPAHGRTSDQT